MPSKSNGPKASSTNSASSAGMPGADLSDCSTAGESSCMSSAVAAEA